MHKKIAKYILTFFALIAIIGAFLPTKANAQDGIGTQIGNQLQDLLDPEDIDSDPGSENEAPAALVQMVQSIVQISLMVATLAVIILFIVVAYNMVTSQGNPEKLNEAKEIAVNAIIGFMMIAMASTILWILANLVGIDKLF